MHCFRVVTVGRTSATATRIFIESMANRYRVDIKGLKLRIGGAAKKSCSDSIAHEAHTSLPHKSHSESSSHKAHSDSAGNKPRIERTARKSLIETTDRKSPIGSTSSKSQEHIGKYRMLGYLFSTPAVLLTCHSSQWQMCKRFVD